MIVLGEPLTLSLFFDRYRVSGARYRPFDRLRMSGSMPERGQLKDPGDGELFTPP